MLVGRFKVSNTNTSGAHPARVRVFLDGAIIAEVYPNRSKPYDYLCKHTLCAERAEFISQLRQNEVSDEDIKLLLTPPSVNKAAAEDVTNLRAQVRELKRAVGKCAAT
jgi:hypothetical protein